MVLTSPPPPALSAELLHPFYTTDELLSNAPILVFYGATSTATINSTSSRIQVHIYSPAGLQSYPRLTISPSSPLYAAVDCLAREDQGDEVTRALAFSLYKYFLELPPVAKQTWELQSNTLGKLPSAPPLFGEAHAAILASRMVKVDNVAEVIQDVRQSLAEQGLSWLDVDVVLPPGSIQETEAQREGRLPEEIAEEEEAEAQYGEYAPLVRVFGDPAFLPTSRLRRAPSKPTGLSRSNMWTREQKENLRREMCEFVDTEGSYVSKVGDLLHNVAEDFRQRARTKSPSSDSPSEEALEGLFPPSLDEILATNAAFLEDIRRVLEGTENDAILDMEATTGEPYARPRDDHPADATGVLAFAKCLVEWFPRFSDCYSDYIAAHAEFGLYLKMFLKETGSSFSKRVQETGEQRLMSMLIEPVQRLPRYNLYIDNLVKQLPVRHPGLRALLKARDTISEICSRDSPSNQQSKVIERLQDLIPSWPRDFYPEGRLITAVDVVELAPPYRKDPRARGASPGILVLFADQLVLLVKSGHKTMSARGLLAEIDNPNVPTGDDRPLIATQLIFLQHMKLSNVWFSEVDDGAMLQMYHSDGSSQPPKTLHSLNASSLCMFYLTGSYEGKAARWLEETAKARVESRFSEAERESNKWEVRCLPGELSLFSAIFEETEDQTVVGRGEPARVRVVMEPEKGAKMLKPGQEGIELVASITSTGDGLFLLETLGENEFSARDRVTATELLPVFTKRVSNFLQMRSQIRNPALTSIFLLRNQQILQSLKIRTDNVEEHVALERADSGRSTSPVKMLSNLFDRHREHGSQRKLHHRPSPSLGDIPRFAPPGPSSPFKTSSRPTSRDDASSIKSNGANSPVDPIIKLEESLATFVLSLHARKGNVVGKVVRNRANADELSVNELYNSLLEDPTNVELAAHSPVDVLFSAFEKFLQVAWREKMGPVAPVDFLISIQSQPDNAYPGDFEEHFIKVFGELSPQNQRAFRAVIKLLADLLEGTGNDGDRGMITAAFAEVLVPGDKAHEFISLLDRFMEDVDALFGRPSSSGSATPSQSSFNSRYGKGSVSSNQSSLKKRFGLGGLHRENSNKSEYESKFGSVWRTLSKGAARNADGQSASLSKATPLLRAHSTDNDARVSPKRPPSRDRPTVLGAFSFDETSPSRGLATIGEARETPRRKRRSSLSDLRELNKNPEPADPAFSPKTPLRIDPPKDTSTSSSRTPSPPKPSGIPNPNRLSTPARLSAPTRKENSSPITANSALPRPRSLHVPSYTSPPPLPPPKTDQVTVTTTRTRKVRSKTFSEDTVAPLSHSRGGSTTSIPTPTPTLHRAKGSVSSISSSINGASGIPALSERPSSGNHRPRISGGVEKPAPLNIKPASAALSLDSPFSPTTTRKLKMQSPAKLRERLQKEQSAIQGADASLQAELSKIGDEIAGISARGSGASSGRPAPLNRLHTEPATPGRHRSPLTPPKKDSPASSGTSIATASTATTTTTTAAAMATDTAALGARIASLETKLKSVLGQLQERHAGMAADVASSLQVSEQRARKLDELYREANAENEALYARFNDELARVLRSVRAGEGVEEMRKKMREAVEEGERLRKENWRLKRESAGLRAQLRE
ncbi:uncharacterized protein K452DRAFT_306960 [Aplosporella prunicola CBS 121167]|uniref:DH domain-containing protein n=1 Tax=Aplosporella prunicola CBS 121167 TaxID=1176127 RepID=A0A6A6BHD6_9PEZI|nr:uncharacterized protein K452DRAFT_306960 [Aplosporella prunicola CBS 121167]KAF2143559.1 hypothetical protein K452DRAFT_306960 [Aplosporella prunicola CBS 121167]